MSGVRQSLTEIKLESQGFLSWNFPIGDAVGGTVQASPVVGAFAIPVRVGMRILNVHSWVTTVAAGGATTACKVAVLNAAGGQLAISADLGGDWESTGLKTNALITPYDVTANGELYVALWHVNATTAVTFARSSNADGLNSVALSGKMLSNTRQVGQATFPATATLVTYNTQTFVAVS